MAKQTTKTGKELERRVADAYRAIGARKVEQDKSLGGHQIDVYVEMETADHALHRVAVEVKDYAGAVGKQVIQDFAAIVDHLYRERLIHEGFVVAAKGFTRPARELAETSKIQLLETADLEAMAAGASLIQKRKAEPNEVGQPTPAIMRLDVVAVPAGWISGGTNPADYISLENESDCHAGAGCLRFTYRVGGDWGGILWWPVGCDWSSAKQSVCGINVLETGGFGVVNRLTFWVRGERGGERIEFAVGSNPGGILPVPRRSLGTITLEATWQQYAINLNGIDLSNAVALFYWGATDENNLNGAVFYLDDIRFEGV
jgi:hypothetical protein